MAVRFSDEQVIRATGATRTRIGSRASYSSVSTDTRQLTDGCLFVALKGESFDAHDFLKVAGEGGAAAVLVQRGHHGASPGPDIAVFEVDDTLVALGALAQSHRKRFSIPIGAVTGSNGKTTTKELVASILETRGPALKTAGNLNNEIGVPLTLFNLEPKHVAGIVEMGMNHAGEIARLTAIAMPDAALITVVQAAHLEGVGSIEGVADAKGELFLGLKAGAIAVVNLDDARIVAQAAKSHATQLTFGRDAGAQVRLTETSPMGRDGLQLTIRCQGADHQVALKLIGDHNATNATAAFALCLALGFTPDECVRGLQAAQTHPRRLQVLAAPDGVTVIDDCYNANPSSMTAALETLAGFSTNGRPIAVLGDMLELGADESVAHRQMGAVASFNAQRVAFFGPRMKAAQLEAAKKLGAQAAHFDDIGPLVSWVQADLHRGDTVLVKGSRGMKLERVVSALTGSATEGGH